MTDLAIARTLHILGVVLWIGGVAMVTTVLLPVIRGWVKPEERFAVFHRLEDRFARQARWTTAIVGVTGLWMTWRLDAWDRFASMEFWWMHAMVLVWVLFTVMLFVLEPLFLHRFLLTRAAEAPAATYRMVERLHWILLSVSLLTVAGAVAGVHGINLFAW